MMFTIVNPPFQAPDEPEHLFKMWGFTNGVFRYQIKNNWRGSVVPVSFVKLYSYYDDLRWSLKKTSVRQTNEFSKIKLEKENTMFLAHSPTGYTHLSYMLSFIVLWLMKIIGVSPILMTYILRIVCLLVYLALGYCAIKIVPAKKWLFFLLLILPLNISQAASINPDGLVFGVVFVFLAYILKLRCDENIKKITNKELLFFGLFAFLIGFLKYAYAPLLLLYFLVPSSKFEDMKSYYKNFGILLFVNFISVAIFLSLVLTSKGLVEYAFVNGNISIMSLLKWILSHPIQYAVMVSKTTFISMNMYFQNTISNIGIGLGVIPFGYTLLYWVLLFLAVFQFSSDEKSLDLDLRAKLVILFCIIFSYLLIITSVFFVYQTYPYILGMQGRYVSPLLPLFMFLFISKKIKLNIKWLCTILVTVAQFLLLITLLNFVVRFY